MIFEKKFIYRGVEIYQHIIPARRVYVPFIISKEIQIYYTLFWCSPSFSFMYDIKKYIDFTLDCPLGRQCPIHLDLDHVSAPKPMQLQLTLDF